MLTLRAAMLALHYCPRWQTAASVGWGVIWVVTLGADQAFWCQPGPRIRTGMCGRRPRPHRAAMSAQPWVHRRHIVAHSCAHPPKCSIHQYPSLECLYRYGYAYTVTGMFSHTWFVHLQRGTLPVAVITAMYIHFDDVHSLSFEHGNM